MVEWFVSSELERMWKEVLVAWYYEVEINFLLEQVRNHKPCKLKIIYLFIYSFFLSFALSSFHFVVYITTNS
jgi:hypothetical protein